MEKKDFNIENHERNRMLFEAPGDYFDQFPVALADKLHTSKNNAGWRQVFTPSFSLGMASVAVFLMVLSLIVQPAGQVSSATASVIVPEPDIIAVLENEESMPAPTEEEIIEQLAMLETEKADREIIDYLMETQMDEEELMDGI